MGGTVALGYDISDHRLMINAAEAETVKGIFQRYLELRSVRLLKENSTGVVSVQDSALQERQPLGRAGILSRRALRVAFQPGLHRRDPAPQRTPPRPARADYGP